MKKKKLSGYWRHWFYRVEHMSFASAKDHGVSILDNNQRGAFEKIKDLKNKIHFINTDIRNRKKCLMQ